MTNCRLPRGGVDRNPSGETNTARRLGRLPRGGVDRNMFATRSSWLAPRRLPRGGVDRNLSGVIAVLARLVASRGEAWIETGSGRRNLQGFWSPPAGRRGSKQMTLADDAGFTRVASRGEAWIETAAPSPCAMVRMVASRGEAWIETNWSCAGLLVGAVASRGEAWIETAVFTSTRRHVSCRLPRGGVDRNIVPKR